MDKAESYILKNIASESNPYAVAVASYALANAGKQNHDVLFKFVSAGKLKNSPYFKTSCYN